MVEYLRGMLLVRLGNPGQVEATPETRQQMARHAQVFDLPQIVETIRLFNAAATDTRSGWQPGLLLELALAEAVEDKAPQLQPPPVATPAVPRPASAAPAAELHNAQTPALAQKAVPPSPDAPAAQPQTRPLAQALPPKPEPSSTSPAPAKEAQPQAARPAEASPHKSTFQDILHAWPRIRTVVKKDHVQTEALMNSCKPLGLKDGALVLGVSNDLLKKLMETGENLKLISQGIFIVLNIEIPIRCTVMGNKAGADLPADLDIEGDGIVGTALNMGGKIVQKD
jgi:DNA polymerase III gamma/tau subunit